MELYKQKDKERLMQKLNRDLLNSGFAFKSDMKIGTKEPLTEKILQFGEGNFLRAFIDYMVDELNSKGLFNGSVTVLQPVPQGLVDVLNTQDGLYTLFARGLINGKEVCEKKIITSVTKGINIYTDFDAYSESIKNPSLRFIVSNTTEAGIVYRAGDKLDDKPPVSFPAKVTALLFQRFKLFSGDKSKGFVFIPCELIDNNGTELRNILLKYAEEWNLGADFVNWVKNANYFTNTLVDRIVTGYPKDEINDLTKELGYSDSLINTCEIFHFLVIEGPKEIAEELPFDKIGLDVVWTNDATPYKMRKVRILNGAHTMSVLAAYMAGKNTVGELMADKYFYAYLQKGLFEEIIPTLDLEYENLKTFADAVFDRFANPYIKHYLLSIALNSVSKYKARVLPSILEYVKRKGGVPTVLTFSFAALLNFYRGKEIKEGVLIGSRNGEEYKIADDAEVLETFKTLWTACDLSEGGISSLVKSICAKGEFWGTDLNAIPGFAEKVSAYLHDLLHHGVKNAMGKIIH
jgi:tagaturonate reductase